MDLVGIGVLLIGISFLILAIYFVRILNNLASVINGVDKTVEQLPNQLDKIFNESGNLLQNSNETLADVNEKLETLTPYFQIVGDVGESTRTLSSSIVDATKSAKRKMDKIDPATQNKRLGGVYGTAALGYYLFQRRNDLKREIAPKSLRKLYDAGERKALEIEQIKVQSRLENTKNNV
ncbi:DUF948 domain-containing protein [Sporosarcina jiandibaonis]|uniref:DUF948 domain-containing protein n=1 Tax=Sporosarcina jiandibaonis TaxID=2715535 RepID=UPI00155505B7|nr:DUF948 domain-containing protein [Sporosarcina jiandibaonis]